MTFNAMSAVVDALKTHLEPVSIPESLQDATPIQLAEARSRLQQISQVANELRKTVDVLLASYLAGGALRYGESIMRPAWRGRPKIVEGAPWWEVVLQGLSLTDSPEALLAALYPANAVRLTALTQLAEALGDDERALRDTFIEYDEPTAVLDVMPISKAPKWAQRLSEGQMSHRTTDGPFVEGLSTEELRTIANQFSGEKNNG